MRIKGTSGAGFQPADPHSCGSSRQECRLRARLPAPRYEELLALGVFGPKSRLGDRIEMLLRRGRTFSAQASIARVTISAVVLLVLLMGASFAPRWIAFAQQEPRPTFEVASIKLNTHCDTADGRSGGRATPGRIALECADLRDLILTAYGIYGNGANPASGSFRMQVIGGPAWMDSTRYDIVAKAAGNPLRAEMYGPMLRSLLEDRFRLKVHRETKQSRVYFLTLAKNGPKLHATKQGTCVSAEINHPPEAANTLTPVCGKPKIGSGGPVATVDIPGATIANLCSQLGTVMDREVIDRTEIAGRFDIHLEVTRADLQTTYVAGRAIEQPGQITADDTDAGPSISTALQQQLGLKLETGRGPVQVIVVDHIGRPSAN